VKNRVLMLEAAESMSPKRFPFRNCKQYSHGGPIGEMLEQLIHKEAIAFEAVAVQSWTRESFVAVDDNTILNTVLVLRWYNLQEESNILETIAKLTPSFSSQRKFK
jgi:hypothetical protein